MAETVITIRHTTLASGVEVIGGTPISPIRRDDPDQPDLTELLNRADRNLSREIGGFFFDTIDEVFVAGFLTPRDASEPGVRESEYFYDIFECQRTSMIESMNLVRLRNGMEEQSVPKPDAEFETRVDHEVTDEWLEDPSESSYSLETVARIWDQYRRDDAARVVTLDELSYFTSVVQGSLTELSFVDTSEEPSELHFSFRNGEPPSFDPEKQSYLLEFLEVIRSERGDRIRFADLPSLATERQRRRDSIIDDRVEGLRDEVDYTEAVRAVWDEVFEQEIVPLIEAHLDEFGELHRSRIDPSEPLGPGTESGGVLGGLLGSDRSPDMEARMEQISDDIVDQMRSATGPLVDEIEAEIDRQVAAMLELSDDRATEFRSSDLYRDSDGDTSK